MLLQPVSSEVKSFRTVHSENRLLVEEVWYLDKQINKRRSAKTIMFCILQAFKNALL